ncbi:MAG: hypothetical protein MUF10_15815 [Thermoanaerobaculaceae bacterium]|jgi:hypothetical protein|nr:hypothetical protein [Thermoanaerobaculaceae bacterium]
MSTTAPLAKLDARAGRIAAVILALCVAGLGMAQPNPPGGAPLPGGGALGASVQDVYGILDANALGPAARGTTRLDLGGQQVALAELLGWVQAFAAEEGRPLSASDRAMRTRRAGELSRMLRQARGALQNGRGGPSARNMAVLAAFDRLAGQLDGLVHAPGMPGGAGFGSGVPSGVPGGVPGGVPAGVMSPGGVPGGLPGGMPGAQGMAPGVPSGLGMPPGGGLPGGVPGGGIAGSPAGVGMPGVPGGPPSGPGGPGVPGALGAPGGAGPLGVPGVPGVPGGAQGGPGVPGATGLTPGGPGAPGVPGLAKAGVPGVGKPAGTTKGVAGVPTPPVGLPTAVPRPPSS